MLKARNRRVGSSRSEGKSVGNFHSSDYLEEEREKE
jgi:hypothetical protein